MFFNNLKENYDKLSISEQQAIDYLMKQDNIEYVTLKEIGQAVLVSSSTIIRACKKLGYNTFIDLKYDLRTSKELSKSENSSTSNFVQLKEQLSVEFGRTMSILNQKDFEIFSDIIIKSRRIFCVGSGSSYMVMSDFNRKLKLINLWSNDYFEHYSIKRISDISTNKDVILVFSLGGNTEIINDSLLEAKQNGTTILSITSLSNSPLAKISDHVIKVYDAPKTRKKIRSRLMLNVVGIILFETIVNTMSPGQYIID
ncbi:MULTISPECIES: MurR/RpiR family transcriptional regulator [Gemella]|uniref:MurR/RpiR family transcriptional regulator n=1 Tax=Gemella TaxID=1378 RepID=UPI0007680AE4|nr:MULTISPECIES: MurR/RpiR family transcriptional regulator [Gemella]AME08703.1 RpiR family transcriptional regulator [Gemella sp. oral taxon 928]